ncbi:O-antigen ligase family protein [Novosphingobium aerophilum]|uniref:O-antigen ligase family protein n=1 Tax=Novosphingobium TaxID=165696 RepID=UPI00104D3C9B|nr:MULTISPECIES: hypothetical protein [unclassified Novosphingobium]MPS67110.1 hypothetical protein [Novosphingobium sp.]WRT94087.1 hypothetical protein U9J33_06135 [Novosphingobium sp. RL4]
MAAIITQASPEFPAGLPKPVPGVIPDAGWQQPARLPGHSAYRPATASVSPYERVIAVLLPVAAFFLSWWQVGRIPAFNLTMSDILLLVCTLLMLASRGLNAAMMGRMSAIWVLGLVMLLGGMLVGSVTHGDSERWPVVAGQYAFALLLIPMLLANCSHALLQKCAIAYVLGVAVSQAIGIAMVNLLSRAAITQYVNKYVVTGNGRLGAMTGEPNSNGAVCVFALIFLIHAVIDKRLKTVFAVPLALVIVAGLVYCASFTAFTATILSIGFILAFSRIRTVISIAVPVLLVVTAYVGLGGPVPAVFEQRVGDAVVTGDPTKAGTFVGRSVLIEEAWQMSGNNLLIGLGSDGYRKASSYGMPVHQLYLLVLNEGGIVSFLGLFVMFLAMLVEGLFIARRNKAAGVSALASLGVFFMYAMSLPHMFARMWNGPVVLMFALAGAATFTAARRERRPRHGSWKPDEREGDEPSLRPQTIRTLEAG